ncbi:macrolide ABC transporter ATP-binding protein [Candidatus Bathyarchaeota archaeon]|nr:MAG: macrolide ABC transporter ATP-binding protein [Candidatus Bathyarchaeota archaeon]
MNELVITEDLWKIYRVGSVDYPALRGVNMEIYDGEFVALVGPSGSGKSTLLHLIGGLDRPTRGRIMVEGVDLLSLGRNKLAEYRNEKIGFVFQFFNLIPYLTAVENVELTMSIYGLSPKIRRAKALRLLEAFGLSEMAYKRPTELSGGEQQRVAIARALANGPKIILADEPTGNIDSESARTVVEVFRRLVDDEGISVIMVTHNLELTRACDRIIRIRDGRIVGVKGDMGDEE